MITIHLILNAHIDPVWLWPWQAGLDVVLNTARSVCGLLERHDDVIFTSGEAWKYAQIQRLDPPLFARIRALVDAGRWELVGGWWIQPDCNQPSGWGLQRQIALGKAYFEKTFGRFPRIGYNVDTFGHAATLPRLMRAAGQDAYVMMRPGEHEKILPARLFRWRGYQEDSPDQELLAFRIAGGYGTFGDPSPWHLQRCLYDLPDGIEHTMCFMGLGDHGGGPNEQLLAWIRRHADDLPDAKVIFSSPRRFFAAIADQRDLLPEVVGELQHHAVGCYSVQRSVKAKVRQAEHLLRQAEVLLSDPLSPEAVAGHPQGGSDAQPGQRSHQASEIGHEAVANAWRDVCFHHFHDTLGGTCIPSAYAQVEAQLGRAMAIADEQLQLAFRQQVVMLEESALSRFVVCNASDRPFAGYLLQDVWPDLSRWPVACKLLDASGNVIPHQLLQAEAAVPDRLMTRLAWRMALAPGETQVVRVQPLITRPRPRRPQVHYRRSQGHQLWVQTSAGHFGISLGASGGLQLADNLFEIPYLELIDDPTDTWSHDIDRYPEGPSLAAHWDNPLIADQGPLLGALLQRGRIGQSLTFAEWRVYGGESFVELLLRIDWRETHKILKLTWPASTGPLLTRVDGIPGGFLRRDMDGAERPLRDLTLLQPSETPQDTILVGMVCPDVFALDATPQRVRLTLLRSPLMAHHHPHPANQSPRALFADRGEHLFRFRFFAGSTLTPELLENHAWMLMRPPLVAETTAGMPAGDAPTR